jgi:hypothetical protein
MEDMDRQELRDEHPAVPASKAAPASPYTQFFANQSLPAAFRRNPAAFTI